MAKPFDIKKFNCLLQEFNQTIYAIKITGRVIKLSNGHELIDRNEIARCKKRIMHGHTVWKENFDNLYHADPIVRQEYEMMCRSMTSSQGGINCQKQHGEKIKQNLNAGKPWNKGKKGVQEPWNKGLTKESSKSLAQLSESRKGQGNPMYGTTMSDSNRQARSKLMKQRILDGKFTPNSNNRNTHWDSYYIEEKFRSSWEAMYRHHDPDANHEELRIPYIFNGKEYIYIVDFINHTKKLLIEVKPESQCNDPKFRAKKKFAEQWCNDNGYRYIVASEDFFINIGKPSDMSGFDESTKIKIEKFYETYKKNND